MNRQHPKFVHGAVSGLALAAAFAWGAPAWAQAQEGQDPPAAQDDATQVDEIVVTGFRASLNSAIRQKRNETAAVDSIVAEDIGKFPDSNLAESMQRIPGVTLSRGDGGEGRNISVRGLGPSFTRVRINGMEGASQSGGSDIYGAGNNGRSFDFNVFPSEIFSALTARKTPSADLEEGSLGATVDLTAPRPLDFGGDTVFTTTLRGVYNEVSETFDPRFSLLASKSFADGTFGILGSFAYQDRTTREVGYAAVDILSANSNGLSGQPFCTPIGFTPIVPSPVDQGDRGATATMCSTNNPRTSTLTAYNTVAGLRRADLPNTPGSGAFLPRIPRYVNSEQDSQRTGGTLTLQWRPSDDTNISLDMLYSKYDVERRDNYIAGLSLARNINNNGQPMTSVREVEFDSNGSLVYGLFDGMDVRSEGLVDRFVTEFKQVNLNLDHRFSDRFRMTALLGRSESSYDGTLRLQTFMDAIDTRGFAIDTRGGGSVPTLTFGFDVSNPANFQYGPSPDGNRTVIGGFTTQAKPSFNDTENTIVEANFEWNMTDAVTFKFGAQNRVSDFSTYQLNLVPANQPIRALPAGTTLASLTRQITGVGGMFGHGAPDSWAAIDPDKWRSAFGFDSFSYCGIECGAARSNIREEVQSAYGMFAFNFESLPIPIRGDIGVRYVQTDQLAIGYLTVAAPAGSLYPAVGQRNEVNRSYEDTLPSANVVFEFTPDLLGRFSAAKVMSRPELANLTPSAGVTATTRTGNVNNPFLDPIRANTFDAALEWYYNPGSLISIAYFHKDLQSYIQRVTEQVPFSSLGLPNSLLDNTPASPTDIFTVGRFSNTEGGPLNGVELNAQIQLDFLPGLFSNIGVLANYTYVTSEINYFLTTTTSTQNDLIGLSRQSASGTLFYEDDRFSVRTTASYRGKYIRGIPASPGSDLQGNDSTLYVDASASYALTDSIKLIVEAQNLTDEQNRLFIDSKREDTLFETRVGRTFNIGVTARF